jgi:phosphatidylglycerophosphate synthase
MKRLNHISVHDVRMNYYSHEQKVEEDKEGWYGYYIRQISFYPTTLFLNLGISANQATWISIVVLILGCSLLAVGEHMSAIVGALLVNCWFILDYVDGDIARYVKSSSAYGDFIDMLGHYIAGGLLFFAVGLGSYLHSEHLLISRLSGALSEIDASLVLILGSWASLTAIWTRLAYQRFRYTFKDMEIQRGNVLKVRSSSSPLQILLTMAQDLFSLSGLLFPILLIAVVVEVVDAFLLFFAAANTAILILSLARLLSRAAEYDSVTRVE